MSHPLPFTTLGQHHYRHQHQVRCTNTPLSTSTAITPTSSTRTSEGIRDFDEEIGAILPAGDTEHKMWPLQGVPDNWSLVIYKVFNFPHKSVSISPVSVPMVYCI